VPSSLLNTSPLRGTPELGLLPDAALRLDAAGTIIDANEPAAGMLAAEPAAVRGDRAAAPGRPRRRPGCAIGTALWTRGESPEALLRRADGALYADKKRI